MTNRLKMQPAVAADGALVLVTLVWGTTFVVVKVAVETIDPFVFIAARFGLAAIALLAVYGRRLAPGAGATWRVGIVLGLALFAGFALQTLGLRLSSPARAAFITGLSTVLVPLFASALTRATPARGPLIGVGLGFLGLAVLSVPLSPDDLAAGSWQGDLLVFGCAIAFALHIVGLDRFAAYHDSGAIAAAQILTVAAAGALSALIGRGDWTPALAALPTIGYMGVAATAFVFLLQSWAQRHTTATHTALIFTLEPVFAAFFSWLWYGEPIAARTAWGAILIVTGILIAELWRGGRNVRRAAPRETGSP